MTAAPPVTSKKLNRLAVESASFEMVIADNADRIFRFCYRLTGNRPDAEDLAQEVFVAAFESYGRFHGRSSVSTWLYKIALYRWSKLRDGALCSIASLDDAGSRLSSTRFEPSPDRLVLDDAIEQLPESLRLAFVLVKCEGLKYREAATVLDAPQGTIQWRVSEAVRLLRVALSKEE